MLKLSKQASHGCQLHVLGSQTDFQPWVVHIASEQWLIDV